MFSVWRHDKPYEMVVNRKNGVNLFYQGYVYRRKANFRNSVNWVCSKPQSRDGRTTFCPARCVTNASGAIKFGRRSHDHAPSYPVHRFGTNFELAPEDA